MKLKNKIKSFYRHNKMCGGMWGSALALIGVLTPPYGLPTVDCIVLMVIALIYWSENRRADTMKRLLDIVSYRYERYTNDSHKRFLELAEIAKAYKEKAGAYDRIMLDYDSADYE